MPDINRVAPPGRGSTSQGKIFVVGFNKCATRTLHGYLAGNRIPAIHWDYGRLATTMVRNALAGRRLLHGYDHRYRAFSDMILLTDRICVEGNAFFRTLDRDYPGSRFIYNTRSLEDWIQSRIGHRDGSYLRRYKSVLNTDDDAVVIDHWKTVRSRFEHDLYSYFSGRDDLLVFDIAKDEPDSIGAFIGAPLDAVHYRWMNKSGSGDDPSFLTRLKWSIARYLP
jgi:hypothetical protein